MKGTGAFGALIDVAAWYHALAKPGWTPPDLAFGAIWSVIFALTAASGVLAWRAAGRPRLRSGLVGLFSLNVVLNATWAVLFFGLRRPEWALVEAGALWLSVAAMIAFTWPLSRTASLLLAPYLVWVSVAILLNFEVVRLNGFG